jgi:hypothetical protein
MEMVRLSNITHHCPKNGEITNSSTPLPKERFRGEESR